jgi:hypothetical protein
MVLCGFGPDGNAVRWELIIVHVQRIVSFSVNVSEVTPVCRSSPHLAHGRT